MQILSRDQIRFADEYTIQNEPVSSIDLMERAARACVMKIIKKLDEDKPLVVFCGMGNNGGDGLAIARMLIERSYVCEVYVIRHADNFSVDAAINHERLMVLKPECIHNIGSENDLAAIQISENAVVVDALLGTGLNKPVSGLLKSTIDLINHYPNSVFSIDCPSGLYSDKANDEDDSIVHSSLTLTFQYPKLSFLFAQNKKAVPRFEVLNIGLHPALLNLIQTDKFYLTKETTRSILKRREKFAHKGSFGHALLIAGNNTMRGAALIASKACLRSGAGLLTLHSTAMVIDALTVSLPECMSVTDANADHISETGALDNYDVIGIGPGIGTHQETQTVIKKLFHYAKCTLVLDADALNILAENKTWLAFMPAESILTPHPKEFDRLTRKHDNDMERYETAKRFALDNKCILILKGAHTVICMPDGSSYFNSTGNPGLAKGGSGDALTGIITGLVARGYTAAKAALIGVFMHGYAADKCVKNKSQESLLASDLIEKLPKVFYKLEK